MKRICNLRKDPFDARDHLAAPASAALPYRVDLSANLGAVKDQGGSGSCTGQAGSGFMAWLYRSFTQYFPVPPITDAEFSALFLYAEERLQNGTFPDDSGSDSRTLMQVLNQLGVCQESQDPYIDTEIGQKPTDQMLQEALPFRIGAYHRVLFDNNLLTARSVLASGYCRVIGIPVYQAIESDEVVETGLLPAPTQLQTPIGGHEMLVFGYDNSVKIGSSLGAEHVRNSWSLDWGLQGDLWIPYDYYAAVGGNNTADSWVGHCGRPWVPTMGGETP